MLHRYSHRQLCPGAARLLATHVQDSLHRLMLLLRYGFRPVEGKNFIQEANYDEVGPEELIGLPSHLLDMTSS